VSIVLPRCAEHKLKNEDYFTKVLEDDLKAIIKPQYVDMIPKAIKGPNKTVGHNVEARSEMGNMKHIMEVLGKE
jgi:ATP-binding cassette, sub-family E, member 1